MKRHLLRNASIIDENGVLTENNDIYISNGKIERILSCCEENPTEGYTLTDCRDCFITPGFVNLHAHSPMNILKGIAEDVTIDNWFNEKIFPYESKLVKEDVYWGTRLAAAEMINNGVTAFADHYFAQESVYNAVEDSGMRGDIAPTIFGLAEDYKQQLTEAENFINEYRDKNERIKLRLGPHAPYTCPGDILTEIVGTAKKLKVGIHLHVSETLKQVEESIALTGSTPFEVLYKSGGFDIPVIIAHGLWVTEDDLKYLNSNAVIAFCPKTYMKLGMGSGNIYKLKDNLNYSFGTDGAASSNTLSPLEQARIFALKGKDILENSEDFKTEDIWKALMNGHSALDFNSGKIKEGYAADLIIWDLNKACTYPVYDPLTSIIYSSDSTNVKSTMVQGKFLKFNGELQQDVKEIIKNAGELQENLLARGKGQSKVKY